MTKRQKHKLYRLLTQTFGDPLKMDNAQKRRVLVPLGGWLKQSKGNTEGGWNFRNYVADLPERDYNGEDPLAASNTIYRRHALKALSAVRLPPSHWKIGVVVQFPKANENLGIPKTAPDYGYAPRSAKWDYVTKDSGKALTILIPVNYHLTVAKAGLYNDRRRIIQRIWNHRVYSDKETWECSYWDLTGLSREEITWTTAKWHEGYVVRTSTQMAVGPSLSKALGLAMQRTVQGSIKSIMSDGEDD